MSWALEITGLLDILTYETYMIDSLRLLVACLGLS